MAPPASTPAVYGRERVPLLTAAEAEDLDRRTQAGGFPGRALMENAGRAAAAVIHRLYPAGKVIAVVGGGNNGGDALVALRSLQAWGRSVGWIPATSSRPDDALLAGAEIPEVRPEDAATAFARAGVLVDGILGTGARGAPRDAVASLITRMNASGTPIVALDMPTGVDPSTGAVPGACVAAAVTVMFGWPKRGGLFEPARSRCGRLVAVEIGFPPPAGDEFEAALITPDWARSRLPTRAPDAHKNTVGRVLVVAGQAGMSGAAAIAGRSAVRAGAGLVRLVADEASRVIVQSHVPEGLFVDRAESDAVLHAVDASDAVLIGPAIGTGEQGSALLDMVLSRLEDRGCVLDADALTLLADGPALEELGERFVLTPHPGEMSRITGVSPSEITRDPVHHARKLADRTGAAVLLKGAPSVVAAPGRPVLVSTVGSSDQASAAMGDQLGATITTFMAAGAAPRDAAALGLFFGGRAAGIAERGRGLTPHDVAESLSHAFADPGPRRSSLDLPFVIFDQPPRW